MVVRRACARLEHSFIIITIIIAAVVVVVVVVVAAAAAAVVVVISRCSFYIEHLSFFLIN